jgi:phage baseplate assembly protein W
MATNSTTVDKIARRFKGGSSPITQRVDTTPTGTALPFNIVTPLQFPNKTGEALRTTADIVEGVVSDFRNMLLTNYGERLGLPDFGANLNSLLSERLSAEDWNTRCSNQIRSTTRKYMPSINIDSVTINQLPTRNDGFGRMQVTVIYSILVLGVQNNRLDITLTDLG